VLVLLPQSIHFIYFEPYPFTFTSISAGACDTTIGGGEYRCGIALGTGVALTISLATPTWLVQSQQFKVNVGISATQFAIDPATSGVQNIVFTIG